MSSQQSAAGRRPANAAPMEIRKTTDVTTALMVNDFNSPLPSVASTRRRFRAYSHVSVSTTLLTVMLAALEDHWELVVGVQPDPKHRCRKRHEGDRQHRDEV